MQFITLKTIPSQLEYKSPASLSRDSILLALAESEKLHGQALKSVVRISTNLGVKYGSAVYIWEARTMKYVSETHLYDYQRSSMLGKKRDSISEYA